MDAVLAPSGADAVVISEMAWVLIGGAALFFAAVMLLLWLSLRRKRRGGGEDVAHGFRPGLWIVGGGLMLPVSVLSTLMAYNVWRSAQLDTQTSRGAMVISVTAKMWWWEVRYPGAEGDVVLANELHIPVGRPVYLALTSSDVIHSFWVPALAGKMDMVPGRMTGLAVRATQEGVYRGQCAEYCGMQHARMALHVVAEPPAAFEAWLAHQASPQGQESGAVASAATGEPMPLAALALKRGKAAFAAHCAACHTIRGVSSATAQTLGTGQGPGADLGPDLTHVASRLYLAAGTLRNQPGAMAAWIADPQAHKAGVRMPAASGMDAATLQALAAYLEQLK